MGKKIMKKKENRRVWGAVHLKPSGVGIKKMNENVEGVLKEEETESRRNLSA